MEQFGKLMQTVQTMADNVLAVRTTQEEIRAQLSLVNDALADHSRRIAENSASIVKCQEDLKKHFSNVADCKAGLDSQSVAISTCHTSVADLQKTVSEISSSLDHIQDSINARPVLSAPATVTDSSGAASSEEVYGRFLRSHNLILSGLGESDDEDFQAKRIMEAILPGSSQSVVSLSRLGTRREGSRSPRLLKVTFSNVFVPKSILRGKKTALATDFKGVSIRDDKSLQERRRLGELRGQLKARLDAGERNLTIKYIKGIPSITCLSPKN